MITQLHVIWRGIKRLFSRAAWAPTFLGLETHDQDIDDPGLILIQIDGLAYTHFRTALETGRLPFLNRLLQKEHYRHREFYPGLPSTTPSVQGELFYGVPTAVPAFQFKRHQDGKVVKMSDIRAASDVEMRLKQQSKGLLSGGSCYSNIYSGGADEPHFCSSFVGWGQEASRKGFFRRSAFLIINIHVILRVLVLVLIEFILAVTDVFRRKSELSELWCELKFIPIRTIITGVMRELIVFGVRMDTVRGLPIIQANFLGYDEQAHRRGPDSLFAHWTLRGIDFAIKRIWREAHLSERDYHIWIYSDHGQEPTLPYQQLTGHTIQSQVNGLINDSAKPSEPDSKKKGIRHQRAKWLGLWKDFLDYPHEADSGIDITTYGPVAHVYLNGEKTQVDSDQLAHQLVTKASVPMVAWCVDEVVRVQTAEGSWTLPDDGSNVFPDRENADVLAKDLARQVSHEDSGDLVLFGWRRDGKPLTFAIESGSHGGPGLSETSGFLLAPDEMGLFSRDMVRPVDFYHAALEFRGIHVPSNKEAVESSAIVLSGSVRVASYNVHSCRGMDGRYSPGRIARALVRTKADIICLQEVDCLCPRSGEIDQAKEIADKLNMDYCFHPVVRYEADACFGNAIFSRFPMTLHLRESLPLPPGSGTCPRGVMVVEIGGLYVLVTHLSLLYRERRPQIDELVTRPWFQELSDRLLACGDLNTEAHSREGQVLGDHGLRSGQRRCKTWPSSLPLRQLDHILCGNMLQLTHQYPSNTVITRVASDHLPLVADVTISSQLKESTT